MALERIKLEVYLDVPERLSPAKVAQILHAQLPQYLRPVVRLAEQRRESVKESTNNE